MQVYEHACRATQGARPYQEDMAAFLAATEASFAAEPVLVSAPSHLVAVLADGMGGHAGGAVASRIVCEGFLNAYAGDGGAQSVPGRMRQALATANDQLAQKVSEDRMLTGMGSTMIGAVFGPAGVEWISVGDSPLFLWRGGEIALLNEDHSLAPELDRLAAAGRITPEQARSDPRRHMLRSAVAGEEIELIDVSAKPLALLPGDYIILASDGVQTLEPFEIARIVAAFGAEGAQAVANALIREVEAMRVPHQDNTTVVAVRPL